MPSASRVVRRAAQAQTSAQAPSCPPCATLPSAQSALAAVSGGGASAWLAVGRDLLGRTALVYAGMAAGDALAGQRDERRLAHAFAGALGIECFVLAYVALTRPGASPPTP